MTNLDKLIADFKEARSDATELDTICSEEMEEVLEEHGYFSCSENNKECADFIILAANNSDKLIRIIEVMREAIGSYHLHNCDEFDNSRICKSCEAIQQVEKIAGE